MDTAGTLFTGLTLASIVTNGSLTLYLTEKFGTLANDGKVRQETTGNRLVGSYADALTGVSAGVVGLSALYLMFFIYGWYQRRHERSTRLEKVYWLVMLLAVLLGVSLAGMDLHLTENYGQIDNLTFDPASPAANTNYKLRGTYGKATLGVAASSTGMSGIALLWMIVLLVQNREGGGGSKYSRERSRYDFIDL